jgi:hypothetical protein
MNSKHLQRRSEVPANASLSASPFTKPVKSERAKCRKRGLDDHAMDIFVMVACIAMANQPSNYCQLVNPGDTFRSADDCKAALQNDSRYRRDRLAPNIMLTCMNKPHWTWQSIE